MKSYFAKQAPKVISYTNYKYITNENFRNDATIQMIWIANYLRNFLNTLDTHVPRKKGYARASDALCIQPMEMLRIDQNYERGRYLSAFFRKIHFNIHFLFNMVDFY